MDYYQRAGFRGLGAKKRTGRRHLIHGGIHCVWYRFSEGDDPKVFEAKIQIHVIFTWVLSLVAGDVTAVLEAKIINGKLTT